MALDEKSDFIIFAHFTKKTTFFNYSNSYISYNRRGKYFIGRYVVDPYETYILEF